MCKVTQKQKDTEKQRLIEINSSFDLEGKEDIIEVLNGAAGLVKVNLRPYLSKGGTKDKLLEAFIRTANEFHPDKEKLHDYLRVAELLSENGMIGFDLKELKEFFINAETDGYPAIHHSETYRDEYKPAYRVLQKKYLS